MDSSMFEAARTGNVDYLCDLERRNPFILESIIIEGGDNPLHVSVLAGQLDFAREIMKMKPGLAKDLNPNGLTPLHIASAIGSLEIVKELLNRPEASELCLLKGRERRIPLHYAAIKGRVEVIRELVSTCRSSIKEVTSRAETVLHLAVKNNQFEVLTVLVELLDETDISSILNHQDSEGNTILHIAVATKQHEVIDFLLNENSAYKELVDVTMTNKKNLKPLEILSIVPGEAGDVQIADILTRATAARLTTVNDLHQNTDAVSNNETQATNINWIDYIKFQKGRDSPKDLRDALLVVGGLILTSTYQTMLQPPGGYWQEDSSANSTTSYKAGKSIMGTSNQTWYIFFFIANTLGFQASMQMILFLTTGFPLRIELYGSLYALIISYSSGLATIDPTPYGGYFIGFVYITPFLMRYLTIFYRKYIDNRVVCTFCQ